ncbi:MAG: hypothetical protein IPJ06_10505 [Saprospiraceae bacterium]|nr:hypothetical protein [Saprospiraceae bacterium]
MVAQDWTSLVSGYFQDDLRSDDQKTQFPVVDSMLLDFFLKDEWIIKSNARLIWIVVAQIELIADIEHLSNPKRR